MSLRRACLPVSALCTRAFRLVEQLAQIGGAKAETGPLAMIEAVAGEQAVQVTWYDDVDWRV